MLAPSAGRLLMTAVELRQPDPTVDVPVLPAAPPSLPGPHARPRAAGKFLAEGDEKLWIKGVTYGTFRPTPESEGGYRIDRVERDLAEMAANGINSVRLYTPPPRWMLDAALRHGLRVMVGIPWEQHIAFLDDRGRARRIERQVRETVAAVAGHPAVLCYAIGNEIPAPIVRWLGAERVERFLRRLYDAAKAEDPDGLVTYVNYPSTEFLRLPFLDVVAFNVYLEDQERYEAYLARLHNLAGDRPLLMAEIGLDSRRNGTAAQADSLSWQVRSAFSSGCAGTFLFAWTDEWHRGGAEIEDWDFGLVDRAGQPKPALRAVREGFAQVPFPADVPWPRISVVVCSYNGSRTIRDCLDGLGRLDYPDHELIVVNDGSTDATLGIVREYAATRPIRVISQENRGLSAARNAGLAAATGEIVAYTDDDARPDPHWLKFLAWRYLHSDHAGVGGPNIAPPGDGEIADCVANAPGGPVHVLLSDTLAEHVPGVNMSFRVDALRAVGGFDHRYRVAGDDVDACWRVQGAGGTIGFHAGAMVWHHRRNEIRTYWKQQQGYGKAEALLEQKWPERYNGLGHLAWAGRLYGKGLTAMLGGRSRLYSGTWGQAAYQSLYRTAGHGWTSLPLMPEWYLLLAVLLVAGVLGLGWAPLLVAWPLLALAAAPPVVQAAVSARQAIFTSRPRGRRGRWRLRLVTFLMHLLQPLARLRGRIRWGLSTWRMRHGRTARVALPRPRRLTTWSERWVAPEARLGAIEARLKTDGGAVLRGGDFDRWDLELRSGVLGGARLMAAVEEHGGGRQLTRFRITPRVSVVGTASGAALAVLAAAALAGGSTLVALVLGLLAVVLLVRLVAEPALAVGGLVDAVRRGTDEALMP